MASALVLLLPLLRMGNRPASLLLLRHYYHYHYYYYYYYYLTSCMSEPVTASSMAPYTTRETQRG